MRSILLSFSTFLPPFSPSQERKQHNPSQGELGEPPLDPMIGFLCIAESALYPLRLIFFQPSGFFASAKPTMERGRGDGSLFIQYLFISRPFLKKPFLYVCTLFRRLVTPSHLTFLGTACGAIKLMQEREEDGDSSLTFLSLSLSLLIPILFSLFSLLSPARN